MNEKIPSFLRLEDDTLYFNGTGEFIFLVPEIYFERNHAVIDGDVISTIGVLNYNIIKKGETDYTKDIKVFKFPTVFSTRPGSVEKVKNLKIPGVKGAEDYRILHYENNKVDQVVCSIEVAEDITNVEEMMQIFVKTGKVPKNIPYDHLHEYYLENMAVNGGDYGITPQEFGLLVSEQCRDPENIRKPYRLSKAIDSSMVAYDVVSIKEMAKLISPFTAIVSENWDEAVISAGLIPDKDIKDTPMEKIMMGE